MAAAGRFRHRVTIKQKMVTRDDDYNSEVIDWDANDLGPYWASVEPISGVEYLESKQEQSSVNTRVRMRYIPGIDTTMRLLHDGVTYDIQAVINLRNRDREMNLMCMEIEL